MVRESILNVAALLTLSVGLIGCGYEAIPEGQYTLVISSNRCGYVSNPGEGVFVYDKGTVVELVAKGVGNSPFVKWTGDVTAVADVDAAVTSVTMNDGRRSATTRPPLTIPDSRPMRIAATTNPTPPAGKKCAATMAEEESMVPMVR